MPNPIDGQQNSVAQGFQKVLNSHGHAFHYSVLTRINELFAKGKSTWQFAAAEVPVAQGSGTRIDFVLKRPMQPSHRGQPDHFLLAECKRADPALSNWCFIKAPFVRPDYHDGVLLWEQVNLEPSIWRKEPELTLTYSHIAKISAAVYITSVGDNFPSYHIALEVRSGERGDGSGTGNSAIEKAAEQIIRGLNGMVDFLRGEIKVFPESGRIVLIPVVFTTAKLWTSDGDLQSTDLSTGIIDLSSAGFQKVNWLLYEYNTSPGLKHRQTRTRSPVPSFSVGSIVERDFARTIAIVNSGGIEDFLAWAEKCIDHDVAPTA